MVYPVSRIILSPWLRSRLIGVSCVENIPKDRAIIFVANHVGYHDALLILSVLIPYLNRKVFTITEWKLFRIPIFSRWIGAIPLYKDRSKTFERSLQTLQKGESVLIYPEGGINKTDTIRKVKTGAARLALATKVLVIPIGVIRSKAYPKMRLGKFLEIFTGKLSIKIGKPVDLSEFYEKEIDRPLLDTVMKKIMLDVAQLSGKTYFGG